MVAMSAPEFESVVISGVGLIGGSIAAALRARGYTGKIVGMGRNAQRLSAAQDRGLIDDGITRADDCPSCPLLFVSCTPVDAIVSGIRAMAACAQPGSVLTDAGSTKATICRELSSGLPSGVSFVGSHPLAGSEKRGFEFSDSQLFLNRLCVLTPHPETPLRAVEQVRDFWQFLGCETAELPAEVHDRHLAVTSHLPHAVAAALAGLLTAENSRFAATGFQDTTRVASGDPLLWEAILTANSTAVLSAIDAFDARLRELRTAIAKGDSAGIRQWLEFARQSRDARYRS